MGRLIDEDELMKGRVENDPVVIAAKCAPTAYNLDKVVAQLEERKEQALDMFIACPSDDSRSERYRTCNLELKKCLEIVKGDGGDGN